jgi:hypothetical protein
MKELFGENLSLSQCSAPNNCLVHYWFRSEGSHNIEIFSIYFRFHRLWWLLIEKVQRPLCQCL